MDELLRAYAKKRREQAEPAAELHPATRKLLQDEVKRTLAPAPKSTRQSWRVWRWPLLAMWGGMAVLLVMFAMLNAQFRSLAPGEGKVEGRRMKDENKDALTRKLSPPTAVAKKDSAPRDAHVPQDIGSGVVSSAPAGVPPAAAAAPAPGTVAASAGIANAPLGISAAVAATPVPLGTAVAAGETPTAAVLGQTLQAPEGAASGYLQRSERMARSPAASPTPLAANDGLDVAAGNFVQVHDRARGGSASLPPSNLLSNFRMLRSGQKVSVVDADGSVYNGLVLNGNSNRADFRERRVAQEPAKSQKDFTEETNWMFHVTGVNNSLKQNIIFTGNVLDMPWADAFGNTAAQYRNASQLQNTSNASQAPSTQNSRIMGKVQVGGGKPYEIEAKPPSP